MKTIGVLLSGAGVYDGSEIHEAILTLLFLDRQGAKIIPIAPEASLSVVDHQTGNEAGETRSVVVESARLSRGNVKPLDEVSGRDLDGLILPGGFGAAKNLCDYAARGREATVLPAVKTLIRSMIESGKPVGAMCIAPVVVALALTGTDMQPILTIGHDAATAEDLKFFGAVHEKKNVDEVALDEKLKIVSTPAYMLGPGIADIAPGIEKLVAGVLKWA